MHRRTVFLRVTNLTRQGFTIVELLIVIVVIAILATIGVALYDNVATQAYDVSLKTDLDNSKTQLELDRLRNGDYPATIAEVDSGRGLKVSGDNSITYARKPYGYCITASNPEATTVLRLRVVKRVGQIEEGNCNPAVTLLAGSSNTQGFADGSATDARFKANDSNDIAVANNGDIYVSDINNRRIRKITPNGDVSTVAGTGSNGCFGGTTATAEIGRPLGVAWNDATKILYFTGCDGSRLFKATSDGNISIVAGGRSGGLNRCDGASGAGVRLYWARGVTLGPDGYIYVSATETHHICKIDPVTGAATTLAGSGVSGFAEGNGTAAQFSWPWGSAFDLSGNLLVKDSRNNRIRKITPSGDVTTLAGSGASGLANGLGTAATFYYYGPHGMAIDQYEYLYVFESDILRTVSPAGQVDRVGPGWNFPSSVGGYPQGLAFGPDGILYGITPYGVIKIIL